MSPDLRRRTNSFWRVALFPCVLQLLTLYISAFGQDTPRRSGNFPIITPPENFAATEPGPGGLTFGFDTIITGAIGAKGSLPDISKDPEFRTILVKMHGLFADLNKQALAANNDNALKADENKKRERLNSMTNQWNNTVDGVLNSKEKIKIWDPLVILVENHLERVQGAGQTTRLDITSFAHRATVYHELAEGIRIAIKAYDDRKKMIDVLIDEGQLPQGGVVDFGSASDYSRHDRCRRRKRCALELLF